MAKKASTIFVCQECGYESPKWMGQCICGAWNTMVEQKVMPEITDSRRRTGPGNFRDLGAALRSSEAGAAVGSSGTSGIMGLANVGSPLRLGKIKTGASPRKDTGILELNRVLGGGFVKGSLTLISGEPGIGKSTLILQAAIKIAKKEGKVLYVSGEESEEQIKMRADRISPEIPDDLYILTETNMENITLQFEAIKPVFLIIDSIQTMYSEVLESAPGSVSQVRVVGNELMRIGKGTDTPILIVCHVTKSGELAGPKTVEHMVDTVLSFTGERSSDLRILRSVKNRFGTTNEIGAFEMREDGLSDVTNLSQILMEDMEGGSEGSVATAVYEGTRPLILELQALTAPTNMNFPRRTAIGIDLSRLNMLLAVLERRASLSLNTQDVYVNIVGGIKPEGTSTDLAVVLAVFSSFRGILPPPYTLAVGEVGLTGELRTVRHGDKILKEAVNLGFKYLIMPEKNARKLKSPKNLEIIGVSTVYDAIRIFSGKDKKNEFK